MERRSVIALTAVSAGVLVAGTVAGLAVVNAATSSTDQETSALTVVAPPTETRVIEPVADTSAASMPTIVVPEADQTAPRFTRRQAADLVAAATGGTVLKTAKTTHAGYDAYAVQVRRSDGSIVTGHVESTSGVIYDWTVDRAADPAPAYKDDDHDGKGHDDDGDEHHEEHEGDGDDD